MVRVYIEDRPLVFWAFMSHFTHRFIISGPIGYFWIFFIYYQPPLLVTQNFTMLTKFLVILSGYNCRLERWLLNQAKKEEWKVM